MPSKYLYNHYNSFDPESPSYQWANSRQEAIDELNNEDGYICEVVEDTLDASLPSAKDLVDNMLIDKACSLYCDEVYSRLDFKALQTALDPLLAQINQVVAAAIVAAAESPLYQFKEPEFICFEDLKKT